MNNKFKIEVEFTERDSCGTNQPYGWGVYADSYTLVWKPVSADVVMCLEYTNGNRQISCTFEDDPVCIYIDGRLVYRTEEWQA